MTRPRQDSAPFADADCLVAPAPASEAARAEAPRRGRGRLRVEDARELDAQLIAAARDAFMAHGYGATSMAALARSAGVSKTTLYAKFPTKAELFRAVIDQQLARAYGAVESAARQAPKTLASSLRSLAEQTVTQALEPENVSLNRLIEWEAARFPELGEVARSRVRLGIEHIAAYIREFATKDQIPCRDPDGAAELFNFMVRGLYHDICVGARPVAGEELRRLVDRIVGVFLASRAGW
jgi:AcrR family transcriptional regulator